MGKVVLRFEGRMLSKQATCPDFVAVDPSSSCPSGLRCKYSYVCKNNNRAYGAFPGCNGLFEVEGRIATKEDGE